MRTTKLHTTCTCAHGAWQSTDIDLRHGAHASHNVNTIGCFEWVSGVLCVCVFARVCPILRPPSRPSIASIHSILTIPNANCATIWRRAMHTQVTTAADRIASDCVSGCSESIKNRHFLSLFICSAIMPIISGVQICRNRFIYM